MRWLVLFLVSIATIVLIIVFNKRKKEQMKSMKTAIITLVVILVVYKILSRSFFYDDMIRISIISVVSVVFSPIATLIICGLDLMIETIQIDYRYELIDFFTLFSFTIYGLILSFWAKWYKLKEKMITIKTLSVFMSVQVVAIFLLELFVKGIEYKNYKNLEELYFPVFFLSVLMAIPIIMLTCIVLRKKPVINISIKKSTLRIIGRVALLLVVMGFFMPIGCNQNGFQIAEYSTNIDKSIGAMTGSTSGVGVWLYVLFFVSLIGGLMIIPLVRNKKIHIGIDWVSLIIPVVCVIVLLSKLKDITGGSLGDLKLQIGGNVIIIGLIVSLLAIITESFVPE